MEKPTSASEAASRPRAPEKGLLVFIASRSAVCGECGEELGEKAWILPAGERGALCLSCADMDHLIFLPSGLPALTRRARKHSALSAVVLKWSRARKRYERQGLLVEERALSQAESECLSDAASRAARRVREAEREARLDRDYAARFAQRIRERFPGCPPGRERLIAEHACLKYSNRVGRSAAAKRLDNDALNAAVVAHIRHTATDYDKLLGDGMERHQAREAVRLEVQRTLTEWTVGRTA